MATVAIENYMSISVLVQMTLGTDRGRWWADPEFGSDLWLLRQTGKTTADLLTDVKQEIIRALSWLKDDGIAEDVECETELTGKNRINYNVKITKPSGASEIIEGVWYGF
ncbi:phage GP46 family protein [Sediminispirochaeta bajacaliforniensis]|uniref:phage GP46 family protein n=1 Tax=Sediminispirochaeta bajacaliforniensis TaxID=148 RepID=UPI000373EE05|nr:phage GP46 family protein [Sediminispirochaeta bajacaliforniensis]